MALIQTNAQLITAPVTDFINTGFTASGTYDTYQPFTATQKSAYNSSVLTAETANVEFNDGSWSHGGDFGMAFTASDMVEWVAVSSVSAVVTFTADFSYGRTADNVRYSYNKNNIPDGQYCGTWKLDTSTHVLTAEITGFGGLHVAPTAYPVYLSFPYSTRNRGEDNPITVSAYSGTDLEPVYPQYDTTTTGYYSSHSTATCGWNGNPVYLRALGSMQPTAVYDDGPSSGRTAQGKSTIMQIGYYTGYTTTALYGAVTAWPDTFQQDTGYTYSMGPVQTAWKGFPSDSGSITP